MKKIGFNIAMLLSFFMLINVTDVAAQAPNGNGKGKAKGHDKKNTPGVPIDGGASILMAAGAAYGIKKLRDYRKKVNLRG